MSERYYHGGPPGLKSFDKILPSSVTGANSTADYNDVCRRDRVYVTTSIEHATVFAAMHPSRRGCVYRVKPLGKIVADPDCNEPGLSWECEYATVISAVAYSSFVFDLVRAQMFKEYSDEVENQGA